MIGLTLSQNKTHIRVSHTVVYETNCCFKSIKSLESSFVVLNLFHISSKIVSYKFSVSLSLGGENSP